MDMYWVEKFPLLLQVASLLIVFIILAVFGQRKTWISTEVLMAAAVGVGMTAFPRYLLNFQIKASHGNMEELLGRVYGVTLIASCLTWCRVRNSLDATVPLTIMLSRLFMGSVMLMIQLFLIGNEMKKSSKLQFSEQFLPAFVLPTGLWLLGNILHLARSNDFNTYPRHNIRLNHHLRIDAWLQLLVGVAWIAFPSHISTLLMTDKPTNRVAMFLGRSIGALSIGEAITSLQASGFLHNDDKRHLLLTRIAMMVAQCVVAVVSCAYFHTVTWRHIAALSALTVPSLLNAVIGFATDGTAVYQVTVPASPVKQQDNKVL